MLLWSLCLVGLSTLNSPISVEIYTKYCKFSVTDSIYLVQYYQLYIMIPDIIICRSPGGKMGIIDLQCCNYCYLLSGFSLKSQSCMTNIYIYI